jgi:hypothetical protein
MRRLIEQIMLIGVCRMVPLCGQRKREFKIIIVIKIGYIKSLSSPRRNVHVFAGSIYKPLTVLLWIGGGRSTENMSK